MTLTPADIAQLDQAHAEGNADLDRLIRQVQALIRRRGVTVGTAAFTAELQDNPDPLYLAAVAGVAISRLAQQGGPTVTDEVDHLAEICDDPDDNESDYGRGFAAGYRAGLAAAPGRVEFVAAPTPDLRVLAAEAMRIATRGAMLVSDREVLARGVLAAVLPKVAEQLTRRADAVPWSDPTLRRGIQYAASVVRSLAETHPATGPGSTQPAQGALAVAEEAPNAPGSSGGATTEPRDSARAWLAEQICASAIEAGGQALGPPCGSCRRRVDAILNGPGVEISEEPALLPEGAGAGPYRLTTRLSTTTHTQVVIRLPAQPIEDGHDG